MRLYFFYFYLAQRMKNKMTYLYVLLIALVAILAFTFFVVVPKVAMITLPYKWNHVPLGQKRDLAWQYFGKPVNADTLFTIFKKDEWLAKRSNGEYELTLSYGKDTTVQQYTLQFHYNLGLIHATYHLQQGENK